MTTTVKMVLIIMKPKTLKKSVNRNLVVMVLIIIIIIIIIVNVANADI